MDEADTRLDESIAHLLEKGENCKLIVTTLISTRSDTCRCPPAVCLHSLLIQAIRSRRVDLIQACYSDDRYDESLVRKYLGQHLPSPVWEAVLTDDEDVLNCVLASGSDLCAEYLVPIDGQTYTTSPMQAAIRANRFASFMKLFETQRSLEAGKELYCLHDACAYGTLDFVSLLLEDERAAAEVNKLNPDGHTALCVAAWHNPEFVHVLLQGGSNPNLICRDGKSALHTLCRAINCGRVRSTGLRVTSLVQLLLDGGTKLSDSPRSSHLRQLCSRPTEAGQRYAVEFQREYLYLMELLSERSGQESKRLALLDVVGHLYYILCGCLSQRTDPQRFAHSLSSQLIQIRLWAEKIKILIKYGAMSDISCWKRVLVDLVKANRANAILFRDQKFVVGYTECMTTVEKILRIMLPIDSDPEFSEVKGELLILILDQPQLYFRFLCAYMERSSIKCNLAIICHLLLTVQHLPTSNDNGKLIKALKQLKQRTLSMKYLAKKCILKHLRDKNYKSSVEQLPVPRAIQCYLVEDIATFL